MSNIYLGGASPPDYGPGSPSQSSDLFWSPSRISFCGQRYNTLVQNGFFWICSGLQFQIISWKVSLHLEIQLLFISETRKSFCYEFGTTKQLNPPLR